MKAQKESEILELFSKLQEQISSLDKKLDIVMGRVMATPILMSQPQNPVNNGQQQRPAKTMYKITCTDCGKDASLPFRPAEGRPVYCKECFALRKRGNGPIKAEDHNPNMASSFIQAATQAPKASPKKKPAAAKKTAARKKTTAKRK